MYKKLRIACTILSTFFLVAIFPAGAIWDFMGFLVCGLGAALFFVFMLLFKQSQLAQEEKNSALINETKETNEAPECENKEETKNTDDTAKEE